MNKIICLLVAVGCSTAAFAQERQDGLFIGLNLKGGMVKERTTLMTMGWIYSDAVNTDSKRPEIENEAAYGFDAQIGYFFGAKGRWGISTGLVYFRNTGVFTVDSMHLEYKATDKWNDVYRQVITNNGPITENLETTNISVPLLAKYRIMLSKKIGLQADAGFVYNVTLKSTYDASASFNYEAIYRFRKSGDQYVAVYDNSPTPRAEDWLITAEQYRKDKNDGREAEYMQSLQDQGYNVGLNEAATGSGTITHRSGSLGLLFQPSLSFKLNDVVALNVGPYVMLQSVLFSENTIKSRITDKIGEYNSVLNNTLRRSITNYGINIGVGLHF